MNKTTREIDQHQAFPRLLQFHDGGLREVHWFRCFARWPSMLLPRFDSLFSDRKMRPPTMLEQIILNVVVDVWKRLNRSVQLREWRIMGSRCLRSGWEERPVNVDRRECVAVIAVARHHYQEEIVWRTWMPRMVYNRWEMTEQYTGRASRHVFVFLSHWFALISVFVSTNRAGIWTVSKKMSQWWNTG